MRKKYFGFLFLIISILFVPMTGMAKTVSERLEEDISAITMSGAIDLDCVLPKTGPNGSEIEWSWSTQSSADITDLFDTDGKYVPLYGNPTSIKVTLTARLTLEGESAENSFDVYAYRTPKYAVNSFIYERADGTQIRHPENGARLISATAYINPRVQEARVISGIYENARVWDVSHRMLEKSGELEIDVSLGDDIGTKEQKTFIWGKNLNPLAEVNTLNLSDAADKDFYKKSIAISDDGKDAAEAVDKNSSTSFAFDKSPQIKDMGKSLYLRQPDAAQTSNQTVDYTFDGNGLAGSLEISMDFMVTETVGHKGVLYLYNDKNENLLSLLLEDSSLSPKSSGGIPSAEAVGFEQIAAYKWYNLSILLDTDADVADIYLNNQLAKRVNFRTISDYLQKVRIYNPSKHAGGMYIDNITVSENGISRLSEDFSGYDIDTNNIDGWTIKERGEGSVRVTKFADKSLYLKQPHNTQASNQTAEYTFEDSGLAGNIEYSMDFMITETDGTKGILYLYNENRKNLLSLLIQGSVMSANESAEIETSEAVGFAQIVAYKWYNLSISLDTETDTADIYIDGKLAKKVKFRNSSDYLASMLIYNPKREIGGIYIDNITVKENDEQRFAEDFNDYELDTNTMNGWNIKERGNGTVRIAEFTDYELSIFPQSITVDVGRVSEIGAISVEIPDGLKLKYRIEASESKDSYVRVVSHTNESVSGIITDELTRLRARYFKLTICYAENEAGEIVNGAISDIRMTPSVNDTPENIAPLAHITSSSNYYDRNTGENKLAWDERGLVDGITAGTSGRGEWMSYRESNPTVYFSWDEPQLVDEVVIFGTTAEGQNVTGALISFDSGEPIRIDDIPANGTPRYVSFDEREINWMSVQLFGVKGSAGRLSEIQVLKSGEKGERVKYLVPDLKAKIPAGYESRWVVSEDLDNDGDVDFVSARPLYDGDNHETASVCAFNLQGETLWTWGTVGAGTHLPGSDVPCQIYDIDNDGRKEVLIATRSNLIILNGQNGSEKHRFALPVCNTHSSEWSSDSIAIADIMGDGYANDIMVKTRYTDIWAYQSPSDWSEEGDQELIWSACMPNGMSTAHYPMPINIDNDAADEVFVGFCIMDNDGTLISRFDKTDFISPIASYHIDSIAVMNYEEGMALSDMRFAISPCGARNFFMVDGNGKKIWEIDSKIHYETLILGKFVEGGSDKQILTNHIAGDADTTGGGGFESLHIYGYDGTHYKDMLALLSNRYVKSINMTGGEYDYIYSPTDKYILNGEGEVVARLVTAYTEIMPSMRWSAENGYDNDMDGDGTEDITVLGKNANDWYIHIYKNKDGKKTAKKLGTGYNYTLY